MKQGKTKISLAERWQKRRMFIVSLVCIACILTLDLLTVLSFDSFPRDVSMMAESQEAYTIFEEWYAYIGYFFSVCFYMLLLAVMCVVVLTNAWSNRFLTVPALLIWCSSLEVLSILGKVGKMLTASRPNTFSQVAEGLGHLAILPLLLCVIYYMRRYQKLFVPLVLASCFCSSAFLLALSWSSNQAWIYVAGIMSDGVFGICFFVFILFGIMERIKKNDHFRFFLPALIISLCLNLGLRVFVLLMRNGFVLTRVYKDLSALSVSLSYLRSFWLDGILLMTIALLIVSNYLRQYHNHTLQLQSLRLRNEANLEYAHSLQRYETSVRKIKHDISNTLNVALMLCKNGEYAQLQEYLGTLTDQTKNVRTGNHCAHILTNYILLMFEERFSQCDAVFRCKATLPTELGIADTDLAGELNNILQNALDAIKELPSGKRWVDITICYEHGVVRINCRNPYVGEPIVAEDGLLRSGKEDSENHGFGMQIIYELAEKYGGVAVPLFGEGVFEIKVAIPDVPASTAKA